MEEGTEQAMYVVTYTTCGKGRHDKPVTVISTLKAMSEEDAVERVKRGTFLAVTVVEGQEGPLRDARRPHGGRHKTAIGATPWPWLASGNL